jgi:hypothetical protein
MRVFEALACGSLLLTPANTGGLEELFAPGEHLVTYRSTDELEGLIAAYLVDEGSRERIARSGQARALASETYAHRARRLLEVAVPGGLVAPARRQGASRTAARYVRIYCRKGMMESALRAARLLGPFEPAALPAFMHLAKSLIRRRRATAA